MKKTLVLLAFILTAASFTGCADGGKSESVIVIDDNDFMDSEKGDTDGSDVESGDMLPDGEEPRKKSEKSKKSEAFGEEEETSDSNKWDNICGSVSGTNYKNEYFGLKMSTPFGWKLISGKAASALVAYADNFMGWGDVIGDAKTEDDDDSYVKLEALCTNKYNDTGTITVSIIDISSIKYDSELTAEVVISSLDANKNNCSAPETVMFAGKEYVKITYNEDNAVKADYARKEGEYVCVICVAEASLDAVNALSANFTALN